MCHNNWGPYVIWKDVWIGKSVSTLDYLKQNVKRVHVVTSLINGSVKRCLLEVVLQAAVQTICTNFTEKHLCWGTFRGFLKAG